MPDVAPTLAVVAAFAEGTTVIHNIAHLRIKECDRLAVMVSELRKMGADVEEELDRMIIHGQAGGAICTGQRLRPMRIIALPCALPWLACGWPGCGSMVRNVWPSPFLIFGSALRGC